MNKLILFDIDGTLLANTNGHAEAFAVAFKEVYDIYGSVYMVECPGKTDQQIIREVLLNCGVSQTEIDAKMSDCLTAMCDYFGVVKPYVEAKVLPGVADALALLNTEDTVLGLVTGNLEPIAHGKLASAGLDHYFRLGGFGSDATERSALVHEAIQKAREQYGFTVTDNVYLFGDTPQDMQAATVSGARAIGVTTGIYDRQQLEQAGAYKVIDSFADQTAILEALADSHEPVANRS